MNDLLIENDGTIKDPVVLSSIYKLKGDISFIDEDYTSTLKYYQKAESLMSEENIQIKYQLDIVTILLTQDNYDDALITLKDIINNDEVGLNEKNQAEELMAYTKQKLGI